MASTVKTVSRDLGEARIRRQIEELKGVARGPHVNVGVLEEAGNHDGGDGLTVADVAVFNEFGTSRSPERAFMRTTAKSITTKMIALGQSLLSSYIAGKVTLDAALDRMGLTVQAAIKRTIRDWEEPPNAESTIRAKARKTGREKIDRAANKGREAELVALAKYNNPLEDTGQLRNSIDYVKVKA